MTEWYNESSSLYKRPRARTPAPKMLPMAGTMPFPALLGEALAALAAEVAEASFDEALRVTEAISEERLVASAPVAVAATEERLLSLLLSEAWSEVAEARIEDAFDEAEAKTLERDELMELASEASELEMELTAVVF